MSYLDSELFPSEGLVSSAGVVGVQAFVANGFIYTALAVVSLLIFFGEFAWKQCPL